MFAIKRLLIPAMAVMVLFGCNQKKLEELQKKNQELTAQNQLQDSLVNDFVSTFNLFEKNLETIKEKENLIAMSSEDPELRKENKDKILEDMQMINDLLDQNRTLIDELTAKVEKAEGANRRFRSTISRLKNQLAERDQEVTTLKEELATLNFTVESLNTRLDTLRQVADNLSETNDMQTARIALQEEEITEHLEKINSQTEALQTAFYVKGSTKELKAAQVLDNRKLNKDFDERVFTQIDITEVSSIPLNVKKAKLLTAHPSDSYVLNSEGKELASLEITNPEKFWKASKYLVVVTD